MKHDCKSDINLKVLQKRISRSQWKHRQCTISLGRLLKLTVVSHYKIFKISEQMGQYVWKWK